MATDTKAPPGRRQRAGGSSGRPLIGPKAQAHIPQQDYDAICAEADERGVWFTDVLREVIAAGIEARTRGDV
jgi:hypothetical protein